MATRRQEKVERVVQESVCDSISNHLSDPRIKGFISVTGVEMSPDLRNAEIYISVFGVDETAQNKTFMAIKHARTKIQSLLSHKIQSKFCPVLHFHMDEKLKKTMETMRLIEKAKGEFKKDQSSDSQED